MMDDRSARLLISSAYFVAFIMAAVAVADIFGRILPLRAGETSWRIGTVGVVSLGVPSLLLALLIALLTAWYLKHRLALRVLAGASVAFSVLMLVALPFFGLDLLELRRMVAAEGQASFDRAMGRVIIMIATTVVATAWMGATGWKASRRLDRKERPKADKERPAVMVGQAR